MKNLSQILYPLLGLSLFLFTSCSSSDIMQSEKLATLDLSFANEIWNGNTIPDGQLCNSCNENGNSPSIEVSNIPENANALILYFEEGKPNSLNPNFLPGSHGVVGYSLEPGQKRAVVRSISGSSRELPIGFFQVRLPMKKIVGENGAYLPPCDCNGGTWYFAHVKAVIASSTESDDFVELANGNLRMGKIQ